MSEKVVERGYDKIAEWYYKDRLKTKGTSLLLRKVIKRLPKNGRVLDVGCGVGYPVAKFFDKLGYEVVGIDISDKMIKIAKRIVPRAKFYKKDMVKMNFKNESFDIIVSFLALLHVPRQKHKRVLIKMYKILKPKGRILISLSGENEEYTNNWVRGVKMFWSSRSKEKNLELVRDLNFKIVWSKEIGPKKDRHLYVMAEKNNP